MQKRGRKMILEPFLGVYRSRGADLGGDFTFITVYVLKKRFDIATQTVSFRGPGLYFWGL